ncbi:MAG: AraC family transcriptional regulator [Sporolactobacillus sp.]
MAAVNYWSKQGMPVSFKSCCNGPHSLKPHFHQEVSVAFIRRGSCNARFHSLYHLTSGTLLVIPAGVVHNCQPVHSSDWQFDMVYLDKGFAEQMGTGFLGRTTLVKLGNDADRRSVSDCFTAMRRALASGMDMRAPLHTLCDAFDGKDVSIAPHQKRTIPQVIGDLLLFISGHYRQPLSLDQLADYAGINKFELIRQFDMQMGLSPKQYILNLRVNRSKKSLLTTNEPIAAIATDCGFYDQSHYDAAFHAFTGVTPIDYRQSVSMGLEKRGEAKSLDEG